MQTVATVGLDIAKSVSCDEQLSRISAKTVEVIVAFRAEGIHRARVRHGEL